MVACQATFSGDILSEYQGGHRMNQQFIQKLKTYTEAPQGQVLFRYLLREDSYTSETGEDIKRAGQNKEWAGENIARVEGDTVREKETSVNTDLSKYVLLLEDIEDYIEDSKNKESFGTMLMKYIDETGLPDAEIYKSAGIDRRHFSKIRCDKDYRPKKSTALALCLALRLDVEKASEMLALAGYSLSSSDTGDLVVKFCFEKGIYDLIEVNEVLNYFGVKAISMLKDKR